MKVNTQASTQSKLPTTKPVKLSKEDIQAKIQAKFGEVAKKKAPPVKDNVEINKKGVANSTEENFGDVGSNDPNAEVTQEKLKSILKNGGFNFNDKERRALGQILK